MTVKIVDTRRTSESERGWPVLLLLAALIYGAAGAAAVLVGVVL
jgi:hypothetical protein